MNRLAGIAPLAALAAIPSAHAAGLSPPPPLDSGVDASLRALGPPPVEPSQCVSIPEALFVSKRFQADRGFEVLLNGEPQVLVLEPAEYNLSFGRDGVPLKVDLDPGEEVYFDGACLRLRGYAAPHWKDALPLVVRSDLRQSDLVVGAAIGRRFGEAGAFGRFSVAGWTTLLIAQIGITDRLQWPTLPALTYRLGGDELEWHVWLGMHDWGFAIPDDQVPIPFLDPGTTDATIPDFRLSAFLGAGLDLRWWTTTNSSFVATTYLSTVAQIAISEEARFAPDTLTQHVTVGYSATLPRNILTIAFGVGVGGNWLYQGKAVKFAPTGRRMGMTVSFGSIQSVALRRLPLIQVHFTEALFGEFHAWAVHEIRTGLWQENFMLGIGAAL